MVAELRRALATFDHGPTSWGWGPVRQGLMVAKAAR